MTFPVRIWPQVPSPHRSYSFTSFSDGMPRDPTSFASKLAMRSDMATLRNRFCADRLENGNTRGSPSGLESGLVALEPKRGTAVVDDIVYEF